MTKRASAHSRSSATRAQNVILEQIQSQMRLVVESTLATREELGAQIADLKADLSLRISVLEEAVRQNSADIREHSRVLGEHSRVLGEHSRILREHSEIIREHSEVLRQHSAAIQELRRDVERLSDRTEVRTLEVRVAAIEARLGIQHRE
jgi:hypothetical protein